MWKQVLHSQTSYLGVWGWGRATRRVVVPTKRRASNDAKLGSFDNIIDAGAPAIKIESGAVLKLGGHPT